MRGPEFELSSSFFYTCYIVHIFITQYICTRKAIYWFYTNLKGTVLRMSSFKQTKNIKIWETCGKLSYPWTYIKYIWVELSNLLRSRLKITSGVESRSNIWRTRSWNRKANFSYHVGCFFLLPCKHSLHLNVIHGKILLTLNRNVWK